MTAQIIPFPIAPKWPADRGDYLVALGRMLARGKDSISDGEARQSALAFEGMVAKEREITAGMTTMERRARLVSLIQDAIATASPRDA